MKVRRLMPASLGRALRLVWDSSPGWTLASAALLLLQTALALASLALIKMVIDAITAGAGAADPAGAFQKVVILIGLTAGVVLLTALCDSGEIAIGEIHRDLVSDHMQGIVHAKAMDVDVEYYENAAYHNTLHRVQAEATTRATAILNSLLQTGRSGVSLLAIAGFLFTFNWWVALILVIGDIPGALIRIRMVWNQHQWDLQHTPMERQARYFSMLLSVRNFVQEIRLFDLGVLFIGRFRALRLRLSGERKQLVARRVSAELAGHAFVALAIGAAYATVAYQAFAGAITIGDVVMYYAAFQRGHGYLRNLLIGFTRFYENSLFLTELSDFLALEPKIVDPERPLPVPRPLRAGIAFEHVDFRYPGASRHALQDVGLVARPGERIAIVGPNGSGKTTLVKLLCRLYAPSAGRITADGVPISSFAKKEWRREISAFFQDHGKYHLTARENIWFGNMTPDPDEAPIIAAAQATGAHQVIERLPDGYATVLGTVLEQGAELSMGEWQKVALARTFLRDAQIVILDEPTNAMDALSEQQAMESIWTAAPDRIRILISHRLSAVRQADRIYVLSDGRIVESGTHDELMRRHGAYADLFTVQAQHYQ